MSTAPETLSQVLDHFASTGETPGNWWAASEDGSSYCLDHQSKDGSKFWIDLHRDGTIVVLWKPAGATRPMVLQYAAAATEAV